MIDRMNRYAEVHARSLRDTEGFWGEAAREIDWIEPAKKDRWKLAIQLDEEPTIGVHEPDAATRIAPQSNQLKSQGHSLLLAEPST
jgi:Acetyl-coenzyme A synthetase N-terminus